MPFDGRPRTSALAVTLLASAARVASGTTVATPIRISDAANGVILELDVTAAATVAGDTLDVTVQTRSDNANWVDVCHFTQILGNGGAKRYFAALNAGQAMTMFEKGTALAAGSQRNLVGDDWAVVWTVVSSSAPSFTFSLTACPQ